MPVFPANLNITSLNGINGFAISGAGYSVSGAGDVNGDGIADLVIGAPSSIGISACYVLFGKLGLGHFGSVSVLSLSGSDGFAITGFPASSSGGYSVSGAGDVNDDGIADLVIGAPTAFSNAGASYVLFGQSVLGSSGMFNVSRLNGSNGFTITGFPASSQGGSSVSSAGDVNKDGIADLVIGANAASSYAGAGYVLFGKSGLGNSGSVSVSSLTGSNGFAITGFLAGSDGGISVSGAGDVNGDGIADIVIGADGASGLQGASYVLFGQSGIGSSGSISVLSFTGSNGFVITGFPTNSQGGHSVSGAGDVNDDGIADLLIGAPVAAPCAGGSCTSCCAGASYVLFGKSGIGGSGSVSVSSLTGSDGFVITGFAVGGVLTGAGGWSVSAIGDMNEDGIADLVIGAPFAFSNSAGNSYVLFGKSGLGSSGRFNVSNLAGSNGFAISFPAYSYGGWSVSGAGDVNGDGVADLVIGLDGPAGSYVVFGGPASLRITKNSLTVKEGQTVMLSSQSLNATTGISTNSTIDSLLQFTLNGIQHGRFFASNNPNVSLTSFLQQQVRSSQIQFSHDGSGWPPAYNVRISSGLAKTPFQAAQITFQQSFALGNNQMSISRGQTVILTSSDLSANDLYNNGNNPSLIFSVTNVQHGYFSFTSTPSTPITQFTQNQIQSGNVQFVQDGTGSSPSYNVAVINGATTIAAKPATVTFSNSGLLLTKNSLTINQNQTVILTLNNINATDLYSGRFNFTVSGVQHGYFSLITSSLMPISAFTSTQIQKGLVQFKQDGSINPPSYSVMASDGQSSSITQVASIVFDVFPTLVTNTLTISQGQAVILTNQDLRAADSYNPGSNNFVFSVSNVQHGYFAYTSTTAIPITKFTQSQIQSGNVVFVQDGSVNAPSFDVTVANRVGSTISQAATIYFQVLPVLLQNSLTIDSGQSALLTTLNLNATAIGNPPPANLIFAVSDVTNGYFAYVDYPTLPILSFSQADINSGQVEFVSNGSSRAPTYSIAVTDGIATANPSPATITFGNAPQILVNQITISQGSAQILDLDHLHAKAPGATNSTLLFLVDNVHHGQFQNYGQSGTSIGNFTQQQLINGNIQFIHDGSNSAPGYSITAFNTAGFKSSSAKSVFRLSSFSSIPSIGYYSASSPAKIWFQAGGTTLPQLKYNRLYVMQGGKTILGSQNMLAIDIQGSPVFNTTFLINGLTHGQFTSVINPSISYLNFSQSQVAAGDIQFIHDGSANVPSYQVIVNQGPYFSAPYSAAIAFQPIYSPPQIIGQLPNQTITVDEAFSFPLTTSVFSDTTPLHFSASSVGGSQLPSWIHFDNVTNYFSGMAAAPGITPIQITAKDAAHLTTSTSFSLKAQPQSQPEPQPQAQSRTSSSGAIIGGVVGGVIGLMLLVMRWYIGRQAQTTLQKAADDEATQKITRVLAKEIFEKVKLTGCCSYLSESNAKAYIKAIENIVSKLDLVNKAQPLTWIDEIANQIKKQANKSYCYSFFNSEISPQELSDKAETIAQAVQQRLLSSSSKLVQSTEDVEMSDVRAVSA